MTKGPLVPSNSTICPRNGPKRRQKAPKIAQCAPAPRNQDRAVSWTTWLQTEFRGHLVHPQPPTFYGFQSSESPNETRRPPYQWSVGAAGGPASPNTVRANGGSTRVPGAKKMIFSKVVPRPLGMLKQAFLGRFEPVVARFGPWKIPKCLENGPFGDQQWVKNGSKTRFCKNDPGRFMMLKQVVLAHFEPVATGFGPWKIPNASFEPKTHRWRPGAGAPSREVPSGDCAVLSPKLTGGAPGRGRQVGRCPPKSAQSWAKNSPFSPKIPQKPGQNAQMKGKVATPHVRLDFTVSKSLLVPFNSTICPRTGPKRR